MRELSEYLPGRAAVKGTMLHAHLRWAAEHVSDLAAALQPHLDSECFTAVSPGVLDTQWVSLRCLVAIDRAIAQVVGGEPTEVFRSLGHHSAATNLAGVYHGYLDDEPHRFFDKMARLHRRFQTFGSSTYEIVGERAGRLRLHDYVEYSPVFCASAIGYYEGALETMQAPGPIHVVETSCTCAGESCCLFEMTF
jgi:predicted hydrocarbon binding protein